VDHCAVLAANLETDTVSKNYCEQLGWKLPIPGKTLVSSWVLPQIAEVSFAIHLFSIP